MAQQVINRVWSAFSACVCYLQAQSEFLGIEIRVGTRYADVTKTNAATFKMGFLFSGSDATDTAMKSSYAGGLFVSAETECPRGWHAERPLADAPLRCDARRAGLVTTSMRHASHLPLLPFRKPRHSRGVQRHLCAGRMRCGSPAADQALV